MRQVDDFALTSPSEDIAKEIFQIIGEELKFAKEDKVPLKYLGLLDDFNGVKIQQSAENVVLSAEGYIERVLRTHGWETPSRTDPAPNRCVPFSPDTLTQIYKDFDPQWTEDTPKFQERENEKGFKYRSVLGELMYAYVTCRPDIGYHCTRDLPQI